MQVVADSPRLATTDVARQIMLNDELSASPRLSYEIDENILTLRASGSPTLHDRKLVYDAVRADATAPKGAHLLWDIREIDIAMFTGYAVVERFWVLVDQLGPKLGHVCGMLVPSALADQADTFQEAGTSVGLASSRVQRRAIRAPVARGLPLKFSV